MDAQTITQAYSALKIIKELGESIIKGKIDEEAKEKIYDMMSRLGSIQDQLFDIRETLIIQQEENHKLRTLNNELQASIELENRIVYEKPSYWIKDKNVTVEEKDGPFCQRCYDADKKLVRLQVSDNDYRVCRECKNSFYGPKHVATPAIRVRRQDPFSGY